MLMSILFIVGTVRIKRHKQLKMEGLDEGVEDHPYWELHPYENNPFKEKRVEGTRATCWSTTHPLSVWDSVGEKTDSKSNNLCKESERNFKKTI